MAVEDEHGELHKTHTHIRPQVPLYHEHFVASCALFHSYHDVRLCIVWVQYLNMSSPGDCGTQVLVRCDRDEPLQQIRETVTLRCTLQML